MSKLSRRACALFCALLLTLTACGGGTAEEKISAYELQKAMVSADHTLPEMLTINSNEQTAQENFPYLSSLDYGKVDGYFLAYSAQGLADELAVIVVKDPAHTDEAVATLKKHVQDRVAMYAVYEPAQAKRAEKAVVFGQGRCAVLIISDEPDLARAAFEGVVGGNAPTPSAAPSATPVVFTRENLPRLDGSTSIAPLGRAVAAVLLGESEESVSDLIQFSRTTASFRALMAGEADLLLVGEPNASVYEEMKDQGFEASIDTFANDALVFVVNASNPVDSLTMEQLRGIYAGEITNWKEVGGDDLPITPFQRNEDAGSQALVKKLLMGDTPLMEAPAGWVIDSMLGLMEAVRSYDNSPGAIGYSVYYYAHDMEMAQGLKLLAVDGVAPSRETIRSEQYPFRNSCYVVMAADTPEDSLTAVLYRWILGPDGQKLVARLGYVAVDAAAGTGG